MTLVFWGYNNLGEHVLKYFIRRKYLVPLVISPTDDQVKNDRLRAIVGDDGTVCSVRSTSSERIKQMIESVRPDMMFSCSFRYKIPKDLIEVNGVRIVNLHGAKLPEYRGGNMINWVLVNGLTETCVTLHYIAEQIDTGDVLAEKYYPIYKTDTAVSLKKRMAENIYKLFDEKLDDILNKKIIPQKQDHSKAYYYPARKPEDGLINWKSNAVDVYNLVRALVSPFPGAFTYYEGRKVIIESCEVLIDNKVHFKQGKIVEVCDDYIIVSTLFNLIKVNEIRDFDFKSLDFKQGEFFSSDTKDEIN